MEVSQQSGYVVIMAGGVGSRFWPASTDEKPKQFLDILGVGKSLLRMTYERCLRFVDRDKIIVITNARYFGLVKNEIPEIEDRQILLEPSRNNTAPCLAYACLRIRSMEENAVFAVLPSDHVILREDQFAELMQSAIQYAGTHDAIVTLGIKPTRADTGYGYIQTVPSEQWPLAVKAFVEKPDKATAESYLESGQFLWNAGIFVWSTQTLLEAFGKYEASIIDILNVQPGIYNTAGEQAYIDAVYPATKNISIDFAILEKADNVFSLPADIGWSDLGTWASLFDYQQKDNDGNVIQGQGPVNISEVTNSLIRIQGQKKAIIRGLSNYIVVDEEDALLIYPKNNEQDIKNAVNKLMSK
jgi:mannose-1-phosphate guanylyltransferase